MKYIIKLIEWMEYVIYIYKLLCNCINYKNTNRKNIKQKLKIYNFQVIIFIIILTINNNFY